MWFLIRRNIAKYVLKIILKKKVRFHVFSFLIFLFFECFLQNCFMDRLSHSSHIWEYNYKTDFLKLEFLFSISSSILSRNIA